MALLGGSHLRHDESTVRTGLLYWELFKCSSTSFGVTQITCCPFQYFTMLRDCRVLMMSFCVILVISLKYEYRHEKTCFCICENKGADQLCGNRTADQCLCLRYIDSVIPFPFLNQKCQAPSHLLWLYSPICVVPGRKSRTQ